MPKRTSKSLAPTHEAGVASATIGFRLPPEQCAELLRQAEDLGVSPHALAKLLTMRGLIDAADRQQQFSALQQLFTQIQSMRTDLALVAEALLTQAGKVSAADANKWARENLNPEEE